ncbi:hypothetical protein, partial [Bacteroides coprosuis]|uniref:hypothetical protein n=1 Tax=Bacteroides coprosuis TaxID=151276 RepID=UPI001D446549
CSSDDDDNKDPEEETSKLVGTWNLDSTSPLIFEWEAKEGVKDFQIVLPKENGEQVLEVSQLIDMAKSFVNPKLKTVIETVTFHKDGNITASYKDQQATEFTESVKGLATYKVLPKEKLSVQLHADAIIKEAKVTDEMSIEMMTKYMKEPFVISYDLDKNDTELECYLDLEFVKKYMKMVPNILESGVIPENLQPAIKSIFEQVDDLFGKTEEFELGLNMNKH